jgi:hypothetical protein
MLTDWCNRPFGESRTPLVGQPRRRRASRRRALLCSLPALVVLAWTHPCLAAPDRNAPAAGRGIVWGINSHPVQGGPSTVIPLPRQMAILREAGLRSYRMDVYSTGQIDILDAVIAAGRAGGVSVLPDLIPDLDSAGDPAKAYDAGYRLAEAYAKRFSADIAIWELGNEGDNWVGMVGNGADIAQYNSGRYVRAREATRGMLDGLHAGNPAAKGIVNGAGWCHWGFQQQLWHDGLRWDITGWHWYSSYGDIENAVGCRGVNILEKLRDSFGRPIWLTEINVDRNGSDKIAMGRWLSATMAQLDNVATKYNIGAAYIYVLFKPDAAGDYGIVDATSGTPLPTMAYEAVKAYLAQHPSATY